MHLITLFIFFLIGSFVCNSQEYDSLPLNDIRILASHNSYKKKPDPKVIKFLGHFHKQLGEENDPKRIDYGHETLPVQLDTFGIRGFELDVYYDPKGGRYYKRKINGPISGKHKKSKIQSLKKPGFKILHISDVDFETHYYTFIDALKELKTWSQNHPNHIPLFVNIEAKGSGLGDESGFLRLLGFKRALKFDSTAYCALNDEISSILDSNIIFTPNQLKANYNTIKERLDTEGWPTLSECRGKIFFILEGNNSQIYSDFIAQGDNVPMFVYSQPEGDNTAFVVKNNAPENIKEIQELSERYMVRTRADVETIEARNMDYSRFEACLQSNAQIVSTDYYRKDAELSEFEVKYEHLFLIRK